MRHAEGERYELIAFPQVPFRPEALIVIPSPLGKGYVLDIVVQQRSFLIAPGKIAAEAFWPRDHVLGDIMGREAEYVNPLHQWGDAMPIVGEKDTCSVKLEGPIAGIAWWGTAMSREWEPHTGPVIPGGNR